MSTVVLAPLQGFAWDGDEAQIADAVRIQRFETPPDVAGLQQHLPEWEWDRISGASHWLIYDVNETIEPTAVEVTNLVLLSLWLVRPTKTRIDFRFVIDQAPSGNQTLSRVLERFSWIEDTAATAYTDEDVVQASKMFEILLMLLSNRGRLSDALVLTIIGCWSHGWQVALICHAAAAEALLTYKEGRGLTQRLATVFACLTEQEEQARIAAFLEFSTLYEARSDVMHGRMFRIAKKNRLDLLDRLQTALRQAWQTVALSSAHIDALEGDDERRARHFEGLTAGFTPPKKTS